MSQTQVRLGVCALAILTCLAFGSSTAYADGNKPRVEAAGWYFSSNLSTNNNEIKIGVTGKCDLGAICPGGSPIGRFEYFNTITGLRVHGKIDSVQFHPQSCANVPEPTTTPAVTVQGHCDDGASCSFTADLVDGGDKKTGTGDWVCNVGVTGGQNKNHVPVGAEQEDAQQLQKGSIKIRDYQP